MPKQKASFISEPAFLAIVLLLLISLAVNVFLSLPKSSAAPAMYVPHAPQVAMLDNKQTLVYELYVSNETKMEFSKIEVYDNSTGALIKTLQGDDLNRSSTAPIRGLYAYIFYMWVEPTEAPKAIYHKVYLKDGRVFEGAVTAIDSTPLLVIASPLRGDKWLVGNGPSNYVGHRKTIFNLNGKPFISQRYAIDFIQFGANDKMYDTNGKTNEDFPCYGVNVYSVADGTVVDAKDGLADNIPGQKPVPTVAWAGGNSMVIDIGNGNYAFYAHMIPGSETFKVGDKVKKGDVIGRLGSSGNSDLPHLHFHIMNGKDALFAEGKPYVFEPYALVGTARDWDKLLANDAPWTGRFITGYAPGASMGEGKMDREHSMPIDGDVVNFGNE